MKKAIIMVSVILLTQQVTQAQGTTYLSNLGQPSAGSLAVGSDSWIASGFITGNNAGGYWLNSIQFGMADATGSPSGLTVMLYAQSSDPSGVLPGSSLGTLNGSANPSTTGIYTYTPSLSLMLSPDTIYFIELTAGTTVANGAYQWNYADTQSYNPIGNWGGGGTALGSGNGSFWYQFGPPFYYPQFAITADPIPEPGVLSLFILGGLCFLWRRRKLC